MYKLNYISNNSQNKIVFVKYLNLCFYCNLALHANISNFWEGGGYFPLKYTPLYCYEAHLHLIWILSTNILRFQDRGRRGELQ